MILDRADEERIIRTMESAVSVRNSRDFFLWSQGALQALVPHRVLVCLQYDEAYQLRHVDCFRSTYVSPELVTALCAPDSGLAVRLAGYCIEGGHFPCVLRPNTGPAEGPAAELCAAIGGLGLQNALVHGTDLLVSGASVFVLLSVDDMVNDRHVFFLDLFLPYLHLLSLRIRPVDQNRDRADEALQRLSGREREILGWITQGKSNSEIGSILHLSPLTVKNHLQRIYRKLNVHNRAHAVSKFRAIPAARQG